MLPSAELVTMRDAANRTLGTTSADQATIKRRAGQLTYGPFPARLVRGVSNEQVYAERLGQLQGWTVVLPVHERWVPSTAYGLGRVVIPRTGTVPLAYRATAAGTSAATDPPWPGVIGQTVNDGTVIWTASALEDGPDLRADDWIVIRGKTLEILDPDAGKTWPVLRRVICMEAKGA